MTSRINHKECDHGYCICICEICRGGIGIEER